MKVLQINSVCGYGSTGRIATDIYKILKDQGNECLIAYGRGNDLEEEEFIKIGSSLDNYIHVAMTRILDKQGFASSKATEEFIKKAKKYNPDVIHLHNIHGYYINIELLFNYLKEINKPIIWTLHDCWAFTGHCAYFDYANCYRWKNGCYDCPQKKSYPKSLISNNSKWNYEKKKQLFLGLKNMTIVTPSNWLANLVKQSFLNEYDIRVINNGIDLTVFNPKDKYIFRKKYDLENKFLILGVASVWDERKGLKYFIQLSKYINDDSRIILVGLNDKQLEGLPKNIIGIKRTNSIEELAEIYSSVDVFVNPTLEEVLGLVNLEALACGVPVITFNTGGSVECVDESCGIIVEKDNLQGLIESISEIQKNTFDKNKCIEKARSFEKNNKYSSYIQLYKEVLNLN